MIKGICGKVTEILFILNCSYAYLPYMQLQKNAKFT